MGKVCVQSDASKEGAEDSGDSIVTYKQFQALENKVDQLIMLQKDLAAKIEMVIEDLQSGAKLGKAAKLRAEREFSSSVMADAHLGLYKDVLDKVSR